MGDDAQRDELAQALDRSHEQLLRYARDLNETAARERAAHHQLQAYAQDLKAALQAERHRAEQLEKAHLDTIERLTRASQYKDLETGNHLLRLAHYARILAREAGASEQETSLISRAAPMHDVGKIGIPDAVLRKPGPLDDEEWRQMRRHPAIGASLLKGSASPLIETARQVALHHHECWDGSGYPRGVAGKTIPFSGRVVMLVDVYDALRSPRHYKPAFGHARVVSIMTEGDGRTEPKHFDPELLDVFIRLHPVLDQIYTRFAD